MRASHALARGGVDEALREVPAELAPPGVAPAAVLAVTAMLADVAVRADDRQLVEAVLA